MPFTVIKGSFELVGRTAGGNPSGFQPDGDSMQFKPHDPALLDGLQRVSQPVRLTSIGSTQLRFEGIDALELHFGGTHQPRPLADQARGLLTRALGLDPVRYRPPALLTVQPPVPHPESPGYILARALEVHGRPVSFVFTGTTAHPDGASVTLDAGMLRTSINHRLIAEGQAYPLFYDTLFPDLRGVLAEAAAAARDRGIGIWKRDRSKTGVGLRDQADLERNAVVFPKLFRRLTSFLATGGSGAAGFLAWLAGTREQVLDLTTGGFTHFDNVLAVKGRKIRLTRLPEEIVFVSAKTASEAVAPWVRL